MPDRPRCPVVHFDHTSAEHAADPVSGYRRLREAGPVVWTEAHGGYYVVTDYEHVFEAARTEQVFSSARTSAGGEGLATVIPKVPVHLHIPVELDPPRSREYRKILNPVTTPAAVESLRPMIRAYTTWFIDQVIEEGQCDFASVIGVPAVVTLDWLGMDPGDWRRYSSALHAVLANRAGSPEHTRAVDDDLPWITEQIRAAVRDRRSAPREDIISWIVTQDVDGSPISDDDAYSMVELLISGGVGTTASLVSQALVHLANDTGQRRQLQSEPAQLERAVEEFMRAFSPTQALARTVTQPVELAGCPLQPGDRVLLAWASANRDPNAFDDPDRVDIQRWPNRHAGFGIGVHRCAGSHLGRAMAREILGQVITRMPDYEVDVAALETYPSQGVNAGYQRIPARFSPGVQLGSSVQL
ncbi:MAG: cytochrome P450 [Candidatus Nanopelagicales bacterium]